MLRIGLIDIDSYNFPNLALMKLSAHHKAGGDTVEFCNHLAHYDIIYKSKVFTYTPDDIYYTNAKNVILGGTGYEDYKVILPDKIEHIYPDYLLYNQDKAYGFLTRGCPNKCKFCVVPKKEGGIKPNADITEFWHNQKTAILLDNNVLASDWGLKQIEKLIKLKIKVDFNQGLDARIIAGNSDIAKLLSKLAWEKPLRMACDSKKQISQVIEATKLLRKFNTTPKNYFIYLLVKDIQDAHDRAVILKQHNLDPFAQPFRDFINTPPTKEQKRFARWVNYKAIFKTVDYKDYNSGGDNAR